MKTAWKKTQVVYFAIKRLFDIIFSLIGLILLIPVFIIIGPIIKLQDGGPVFFKQKRTGRYGKEFMLVKFRSMAVDNDAHNFKVEDQITPIGKFIRKTSIDELPQFWNVFKGDMSFIGPRPWLREYHDNMNSEQRRRYDVRPGITGLAQVKGRNNIDILDKIKYDIEYVDKMSFHQDAKVFFLTIKVVTMGKGVAHKKGSIENETVTLERINSEIKKMSPLVSIVTPVYNAEQFISETIKSVLDQTYENWELILVNDCSTDDSKKVAKPYLKDKRIRWADLKTNSGAAASRNKGIELAKGRFIAFLDADDLWKKNKLEKQVKFMLEKDCEFSYTSYEFASENGKPNGKKVLVPQRMCYKQALKNTTIFTSTVMFDTEKLSKDSIKMPNVPSEDTATWWKVLKKIPYAYGMRTVFSFYRRSKNTLSSSKKKAVSRIWYLYRKVERINPIKSFYYFCRYAFNATRRRM